MTRLLLIVFLLASVGAVMFYFWPQEQELNVSPEVLTKLKAIRQSDTFADLPGDDIAAEKARLNKILNHLLSRLINGLEAHPRKSWLIDQMKPTVQQIYLEDTEARERFVQYLVEILNITGVRSTDGAFIRYLIFI